MIGFGGLQGLPGLKVRRGQRAIKAIPASPVRQAQQVRWAQSAQQVPKGRGGPRGLLEIPHKGEVASIGSLVDVLESQPIGQRRAMTFCWLQAPAVLTPSGLTLLRLRKAARGRAN